MSLNNNLDKIVNNIKRINRLAHDTMPKPLNTTKLK